MESVLITGGAGFIGSHLVDVLLARGKHVTVFDNLSTGRLENLEQCLTAKDFTFIQGDLLHQTDVEKLEQDQYDVVFHLAANPEVRVGAIHPDVHFRQNVVATELLLEHFRHSQRDLTMLFTSTSTVYGEPTQIPTKENCAPLMPISIYGATKLACESLISAYAGTYGFRAIICRLANIIGPRSEHGILFDFIQKLRQTPDELEILGDGTQNKSYLFISDCVEALLLVLEQSPEQVGIYNIGSEDQIDVKEIAHLIVEEMGFSNVKLRCTGGVDGGRGWKGDVKNMLLDISKLKALGWKPNRNSRQAMEQAAASLIKKVDW